MNNYVCVCVLFINGILCGRSRAVQFTHNGKFECHVYMHLVHYMDMFVHIIQTIKHDMAFVPE